MRWHLPERITALLLVTLLSACATRGPLPPLEEPPPEPERPPITRAEIRGIAKIIRLEDRREYDDDLLFRSIRASHPELRLRTVRAIGRIGDHRGTELLLRALDDPEPEVRAEAAFALGQLRDTTTSTTTALARLALDPDLETTIRGEALAALAKIGGEGAGETIERALTKLVDDPEAPSDLLGTALLAGWRLPPTDQITAAGIRAAESPDREIRWRATYLLMRHRAPESRSTLLALTADPDPLVRALAIRGLYPGLASRRAEREEIEGALLNALDDPHPHPRINALRALTGFANESIVEFVAKHLDDPDPKVALTAIEALNSIDGTPPEFFDQIVSDQERPLFQRGTALAGLLEADPATGLRWAGELASSPEWLARLYAARALTSAPGDQATDLLARLARDPDQRVAATAMMTIASLPPPTIEGLRGLLIERLGSYEVGVRAAALKALTPVIAPPDLPVLLEAYERARHDEENDAARAAIHALSELKRRGLPVERSFFQRFPPSTDQIVRRMAAEMIGAEGWGRPTPIETGRDLDFYEAIVESLVVPALEGRPAPRALIETPHGTIILELRPAAAPLTVYNLIRLAESGYFDGSRWHRVVPNFVLQDGDPRGDGLGGPGYTIRDEHNRGRYLRGSLGMALDGADTGGSQFFITHAPQPHLDGAYTLFGQVIEGIELADAVVQDDPVLTITIQYDGGELPAPLSGTRVGERDGNS